MLGLYHLKSRTSKIINTHHTDTSDTDLGSCGDDATPHGLHKPSDRCWYEPYRKTSEKIIFLLWTRVQGCSTNRAWDPIRKKKQKTNYCIADSECYPCRDCLLSTRTERSPAEKSGMCKTRLPSSSDYIFLLHQTTRVRGRQVWSLTCYPAQPDWYVCHSERKNNPRELRWIQTQYPKYWTGKVLIKFSKGQSTVGFGSFRLWL